MLDVGLLVARRGRSAPEAIAPTFVDHQDAAPGDVEALYAAEALRVAVRQRDAVADAFVTLLVRGQRRRHGWNDCWNRRDPLVPHRPECVHRPAQLTPDDIGAALDANVALQPRSDEAEQGSERASARRRSPGD